MTAEIQSISNQVSPEEWRMRVDLAALYRIVAMYGWDDLIFTHLTARVPGGDHHFLINPYGCLFEEITASSLVKIDLDGNKVMDSPYDINPAGFTIHSAIHEAREDATCVMHLHTRAGIGVSAQKEGLLPISQQASIVMKNLAYHTYEGIALNPAEKERLVADLGNKNVMILRNHGTLTVARSVAGAFLAMYTLETACQAQIAAQAGGGELIMVPQEIIDGAGAASETTTKNKGGSLAWPALLRKLDRIDPSYKT
ncbi:class II aldolase/adducin family protein [Proteobacteria bacterium 005FR1]|nr:class II aldolase/adducin family protein [Proteobacteria bacterium 005FR1]